MKLLSCWFALLFAAPLAAQSRANWREPFPPHRIIGNIHYVGTADRVSFLITTPEGHILINTNYEETVPLIRAGVEKLGFRFGDIKILLAGHAHTDHVGGHALVKELTGARVMAMQGDDAVIAGGKAGKACPVDRVLHDGDEVKLGGTTLVAHHTPGHTKGCTTWTLKAEDGGKSYNVLIYGSMSVNPGYKLVNNDAYPQIAEDYARSFQVLKKLPCDVFLAPHASFYGMQAKYQKLGKGGVNPFIDPEGYRTVVASQEKTFLEKLQEQKKDAR